MKDFETYLKRKNLREGTIKQYVQIANLYEQNKLNISPGTSFGWRYMVSHALKQYQKFKKDKNLEDFIASIPNNETPPLHEKPPLTQKQWQKLYEEFNIKPEPIRSIMLLLLYSGLRVGDIGRIRRDKVEEAMNTGQLYIELKRGKWKNYPFELVKKYLIPLLDFDNWEYLWQLLGEKPNSYYFKIYFLLREASKEIGIKYNINPHLLRRTFATMLLMQTQNLEAVRQLLCHANIQTTQRYVNRLPQQYFVDILKGLDSIRFKNI